FPAQVPPNITLAASENGAVALASLEVGSMPNTAISDNTYTIAVAIVPSTVARGTLRSGSRTLAAATAAGSTPRQMISPMAIPPPISLIALSPLTFQGVKLALEMKNRPTVDMNASTANLMTVVTTCTEPMFFTPDRFTAAGSHSPTSTSSTVI